MTQPGTPQAAKHNPLALISLAVGVLAIAATIGGLVTPAVLLGVIAVLAAPSALTRPHDLAARVQAIGGMVLGAVPLLLFVAFRNG